MLVCTGAVLSQQSRGAVLGQLASPASDLPRAPCSLEPASAMSSWRSSTRACR